MKMGCNQKLFEEIFGSEKKDGIVKLERAERSLAQLINRLAYRSIRKDFSSDPDNDPSDSDPDDDSDDEPNDDGCYDKDDKFDEKIETAMENFERVVELFKLSSDAKKEFLENFNNWSSLRKNNVRRLGDIADEIISDKFNSEIAKVVGSSVGIVGGIMVGLSFLTPLAAITLPLAISGGVATALGGGVVVGTTGTEIVLLKNKLEEAKLLAIEEEKNFSKMEKWFIHTQELKTALETLISYDLLNEMSNDLKKFQDEVEDTLDSLGDELINLLAGCIGKMKKGSKIVELFGVALAPVVMSFVLVVCLIRDHNRLILDCMLQVERFVVGMLSGVGIVVQAGRLGVGIAKGAAAAGRTASIVATSAFVAIGAVIDVVNIVLSSIDIHNRTEPEQAQQIKEVAKKLQEEFKFIEKVHEELKKWKCIDLASVDKWATFVIYDVPNDAVQTDIKMAIKYHIPEEVWGCIRLRKYPIEGNDFLFKVPDSHSKRILKQSHLNVKRQDCRVTKFNQWKTFIIHHVPDQALQKDIKMAVTSHLPEEARGFIHLQRLSTSGNNWLVKVPVRHSQNLAHQSPIIVRGELCLITQ